MSDNSTHGLEQAHVAQEPLPAYTELTQLQSDDLYTWTLVDYSEAGPSAQNPCTDAVNEESWYAGSEVYLDRAQAC